MTQEEFLAYAQLPNHSSDVNVLYDETGPPYTLRALTVPVITQDTPAIDITQYLQQVQEITLPLGAQGSVTVTIRQRSLIESPTLVRYFYFQIDPVQLPVINSPVTGSSIILSPSIDFGEFNVSPYNVLVGSIENLRQSDYIMQSDRYKIGTLDRPYYTGPLNIQALITGSATKANVQDSNYSNTGWINSRYEGTKTSTVDYRTTPATTGRIFQAAEFSSGSSISQINYLQSSSQVIYKDYFYTGTGDTPGITQIRTGFKVSSISPPDSSLFYIYNPEELNKITIPKEGEFIQAGPSLPANNSEIMRVNAVEIYSTSPLRYSLQVTRGYYGAIQDISTNDQIYKISPVQIFNVTANKLSGVPKGRVLAKETGKLLTLDPLGFVLLSS